MAPPAPAQVLGQQGAPEPPGASPPLASSFFSPDFGFLSHTRCEITSFLKSLTAVKLNVQNFYTHLWQVSYEERTLIGTPEGREKKETQDCPSISSWSMNNITQGHK